MIRKIQILSHSATNSSIKINKIKQILHSVTGEMKAKIIILAMIILIRTTNQKQNMVKKALTFDLGVKANILKNIDQNTVDRSTYGRYLTEDFIDLVIKPSFLEIGNKLKELENNIRTQKATLETKTETLNNALFSVSIIVPGGLVILIVTSCILERKTRKLAAKIKYTNDTPGEEERN